MEANLQDALDRYRDHQNELELQVMNSPNNPGKIGYYQPNEDGTWTLRAAIHRDGEVSFYDDDGDEMMVVRVPSDSLAHIYLRALELGFARLFPEISVGKLSLQLELLGEEDEVIDY